MATITTKELSGMDDILNQEHLLVQKFQHYAQGTDDLKLKQQFEQIAEKHQKHFDTIMGLMK